MSDEPLFSARLGRRTVPTSLGDSARLARNDLIDRVIAEGVIEGNVAGDVLSLTNGASKLVPVWQFASLDPAILHPDIPILSTLLRSDEDPLGAIGWFVTPNAWLDGELPSRVLHLAETGALVFAAQQLTNDSW